MQIMLGVLLVLVAMTESDVIRTGQYMQPTNLPANRPKPTNIQSNREFFAEFSITEETQECWGGIRFECRHGMTSQLFTTDQERLNLIVTRVRLDGDGCGCFRKQTLKSI